MNYQNSVEVTHLEDIDKYVVTNEELNPFISLCFLFGIDYDYNAVKIIDLIIEKGIRNYLTSTNYYDVINMAIGDYVSQLPKPHKLNPSYFTWSGKEGVKPMNLSYMYQLKGHYPSFINIYQALLMAFCWGLELIPIFINYESKTGYMADIGFGDNFIHFMDVGDEYKRSTYPLIDHEFRLISSEENIPGIETLIAEDSYSYLDYISSAIDYIDPANPQSSDEMKRYNLENIAAYALYAAMGLDILRIYFERSAVEERKLYNIFYQKVINHNQLNSQEVANKLGF